MSHANVSNQASNVNAAIAALARQRIYFGHQSVGYDILAGIAEAIDSVPGTTLRIVDSADPRELETPGLVHSKVGTNADPISKLQAFANAMDAGVGQRADVALMKFCYVDIESHTDVAALFARYEECFASIGARFPRVRFAHVTAPLTARPGGFKSFIKLKCGKPLWGDEQNRRRHAFNQLLRARYGPIVFDLAKFESTDTNGQPFTHFYAGASQPCMHPSMTHDGGHLSQHGKAVLAREFLLFLAGVGR
jgi:hypothetical protein